MPEAREIVRDLWAVGTVTLERGSRGVPVRGRWRAKERREERWLLRVRRDGNMTKTPDLILDWALDAAPDRMIRDLMAAIRGMS